jgi:hypothetical protein
MQSEWVKTEISKARKREIREKRRILFPVRVVNYETLKQWKCFDPDIGKDSTREIREYNTMFQTSAIGRTTTPIKWNLKSS